MNRVKDALKHEGFGILVTTALGASSAIADVARHARERMQRGAAMLLPTSHGKPAVTT